MKNARIFLGDARHKSVKGGWPSRESDGAKSVSGVHGRAQAKLSGVFGAQKKVQVRIQARIPFFPAMLPVGSGEVASILAKDFLRAWSDPSGLAHKK